MANPKKDPLEIIREKNHRIRNLRQELRIANKSLQSYQKALHASWVNTARFREYYLNKLAEADLESPWVQSRENPSWQYKVAIDGTHVYRLVKPEGWKDGGISPKTWWWPW